MFQFLLGILCLTTGARDATAFHFEIDISKFSGRRIINFWDNTGFSPPEPGHSVPDFLLSSDNTMNLQHVASVPRNGLSYVRVHWLLDMLKYKEKDKTFDWGFLDRFLDILVERRLKPGFEVMGNPGQILTRFDKTTSQLWTNVLEKVVRRYTERYGKSTVSNWRYETWNEPDLKMYNTFNFTLPEFIDYVKATVTGLKGENAGIYIGGPAGLFKSTRHPLCWGFLEHCEKQPNMCGVDYLTFHKKGNGSANKVVDDSISLIREIKTKFPRMGSLPFINDEADILTGWWRPEEWRGDVRYAASLARVVHQFVSSNKERPFAISNDNAFLNVHPNYFTQRTLLTRFHVKDSFGEHSQFFRKPVYIVMGLLSMLPGNELVVNKYHNDERFSVIGSTLGNCSLSCSISVSTVFSTEPMHDDRTKVELSFVVSVPKTPQDAVYAVYMLSNGLPHPKSVWEKFGKPNSPNPALRRRMRKSEGPHRILFGKAQPSTEFKFNVNMTDPSVLHLQLCLNKAKAPGRVTDLRAFNVTYNEVALFWKDGMVETNCLKTFVAEFCRAPCDSNIYERINREDTIWLSFQYVKASCFGEAESTRGRYRVAAVDFWGQKGPYSESIIY